jgi:hypothetical protein
MRDRASLLAIALLVAALGCGSSSSQKGGAAGGTAGSRGDSGAGGLDAAAGSSGGTSGVAGDDAGGASGGGGSSARRGTGADGGGADAVADAGADAKADGAGGPGGAGGGGVGGGADAGTDAPPLVMPSLPGLAAWFDAGKGLVVSNGAVLTWQDQSPNGNDLERTTATSPVGTVVMDDINARPAVNVNGLASNGYLENTAASPSLGFGTGEFLIELVVAAHRDAELLNVPTLMGIAATGNLVQVDFFRAGVMLTSSSTPADGTFHLLGVRRSGTGAGTTLEIRVDGVVDTSKTSADYAVDLFAENGILLGRGIAAFAEAVFVKGPTSSDDLAALETYLKTKYALP